MSRPTSGIESTGIGGRLPGPVTARQDGRWMIADHGAQLLGWQPIDQDAGQQPATLHPVIWFEPADPQELPGVIRGGIPVCAPWFGHGPRDDQEPQHGIMRLTDFDREILTDQADRLAVRYRAELPGVSSLHTVELTGQAATLTLCLTSTGSRSQQVEGVWHSYLRVGDASRAWLEGVRGATFHNYATGRQGRLDADRLAVTIDTDTVVQDPPGPLALIDPAWARRITLQTHCLLSDRRGGRPVDREPAASSQQTGSCPTAVVWNPRRTSGTRTDLTGTAWRDFVCVETGAAKQNAIDLEPGQTLTLGLRIGVTPF